VERREHNQGKINPPLFEKIIDRLEKEWFDLVGGVAHSMAGGHLDGSTNHALQRLTFLHLYLFLFSDRQRTFQSLLRTYLLKIMHATFATMQSARTAMPLFSAMVVTLPCIKVRDESTAITA